jgi:hypothetical protein
VESITDVDQSRIRMLGWLTSVDNEKMFRALEKMLPKRSAPDSDHDYINPPENPQAATDFQLLVKTSFETAYLFLDKALRIDPSNNEISSFMEKIAKELNMNEQEIIHDARSFYDSVDVIDLVEECDNLLNTSRDSASSVSTRGA